MTIKDLKELLEEQLEQLEENYTDEEEISLVNNTYYLKGGYNFICVNWHRIRGFIDLDYPTIKDNEEEEEEY